MERRRDRLRPAPAASPRLGLLVFSILAMWWAVELRRPTPAPEPPNVPQQAGHFLPFVCEPAFGKLSFCDPLGLVPLCDEQGTLLVVERLGAVQAVRGDDRRGYTKTPFLDLGERIVLTRDRAEEGLLGLALHPEFSKQDSPHRGELFAYYVGRNAVGPTNRLSKFKTEKDRPDQVDLKSEQILIDQPDQHQSHNGGGLVFGPDGFLYLALGDDNSARKHAQVITGDLFSGVLRLDVDCKGGEISHPPRRQPKTGRTNGYFIPNENPFVEFPDALEEFFALGFRNPWRMSFDRVTRRLYVSDAGDRHREEINLVAAGSNCCWDYREGSLLRSELSADGAPRPTELVGIETPPLLEYSRDSAHRCAIGGYVYRGRQFPELNGKYVYADQSGRIYALTLDDDGTRAGENVLIAASPEPGIGISSLGEDADGEIYICSIGELATETGRVYRLRRTSPAERELLPDTLAETRLFTDWRTLTPRPESKPYEVKLPFWSDGAEKSRWIILPAGAEARLNPTGNLAFPAGTIFVKHFSLATDARTPGRRRPVETRVLVCTAQGGVFGGTYRWSADGTQTRLVNLEEREKIELIDEDGLPGTQTWIYPGRFDCNQCHNASSGEILGFTLRQLDRDVKSAGMRSESQIAALTRCGVLPARADALARRGKIQPLFALDETSASLEQRVRSYLDVNCSACHNPNRRFAAFMARSQTPLGEAGIVDGMTYHHRSLGPEARIVAPGNVSQSVMHLRMSSTDPVFRMPPLGSTVVDRRAVDVLVDWINSMPRSSPALVEERPNVRDNFRR